MRKPRKSLADLAKETPSHDDVPSRDDTKIVPVEERTQEEYLRALQYIEPLPNAPIPPKGKKHMVIPDTQQKPGADNRIMSWLGQYALDQRPDVIIFLGDHWDMPSLSSWDKGKRAAENRRYWMDIHAGNIALDLFMAPLYAYWDDPAYADDDWWPEIHFLIGNHEYRIMRWLECEPQLEGVIGYHHFNLTEHGIEVHDFLDPVEIDGIRYAHFFPRGPRGTIVQTHRGAPNARLQVQREKMSCTAGHTQGYDTHVEQVGHTTFRGVIAGACYLHEEGYMHHGGGNSHWRGCLIKHNVDGLGGYNLMEVDTGYLARRFGGYD